MTMPAPPDKGSADLSSFFKGLWQGSAPLLAWALHFFASYTAVALGCDRHWGQGEVLGMSQLQWVLVGFTAVAATASAAMAARGCRAMKAAPTAVLPWVRSIGALLSLPAMLWTAVPVLWLPTCHFT